MDLTEVLQECSAIPRKLSTRWRPGENYKRDCGTRPLKVLGSLPLTGGVEWACTFVLLHGVVPPSMPPCLPSPSCCSVRVPPGFGCDAVFSYNYNAQAQSFPRSGLLVSSGHATTHVIPVSALLAHW